jgi:two-component SAPR family response regulator
LAAYLSCCNRLTEAQELLQEARRLGQWTAETSKLLIEILFALGDRSGALTITRADAALLSEVDRQRALFALTRLDGPLT